PDGITPELTRAVFELTDKSVSIAGLIEFDKAASDPNEPPQLPLGAMSLSAMYTWGKQSSFTLALELGVSMTPPPTYNLTDNPPLQLVGKLDYSSANGWKVSATCESQNMRGFHLYNFFDPDSQSAAADILSHIQIIYVELDYAYAPAKTGDKSRGS